MYIKPYNLNNDQAKNDANFLKKRLFGLILTLSLRPWPLMTAEGSKWKLWTFTVKYIKLRAFNGAPFKNESSFCQTSFHYLTWPPWLLKIDLRWSKVIAFQPYDMHAYQTIGFKRWSEQKWYLLEEKLFDIITSEEIKMKTWKIYWYVY